MARKRQRRTAEEARRLILDAAERRLEAVGPQGVRLADVADDVGVSHPAVLHHFGTKRGLIDAVVERAIARMEADLVATLADNIDGVGATELVERVFETLHERGHARLLAWLILSRSENDGGAAERIGGERALANVAAAIHRLRAGEGKPLDDDTTFTVVLGGLALFGDAIAGGAMRRSAGLGDDPDAGARFRRWLAQLLLKHLEARPPEGA